MIISVQADVNKIMDKIGKPLSRPEQAKFYLGIGDYLSRLAKTRARAKGGRKFWAEIAGSVGYAYDHSGVIIGAAHRAARHKETGGTISAPGKGLHTTKAQALTIPIHPMARGKRAIDFNGIFKINANGKSFLCITKGKETIFLFVLKKSVYQEADPWFVNNNDANTALDFASRSMFGRS